MESYTWTKLEVSGNPPLPRSAFVMAALQDQVKVVVYGGYSKERLKKEADKGIAHTDMFVLAPEGQGINSYSALTVRYLRKEVNILFNGAHNTFYLWLYGVGHMVKDLSDRESGNSL